MSTDRDRQLALELLEQEKAGVQALGPIPSGIEEFWTTIELPNGFPSKSMVVRPKQSSQSLEPNSSVKRPLTVFFHGGGFGAGSPNMVTRPARDFAAEFGAVVVCPSYRLVSTAKWPVPAQDGWEVVKYLADHADDLDAVFGANLDDGFVIGGVSAGGGMSAIIAGVAAFDDEKKQTLKKPLTGVFVNCPLLIVEEILPAEYASTFTSREENIDDKNLSMEEVRELLKGLKCTDYKSQWFSPVPAAYDRLQGGNLTNYHHPPTYFQVCQFDPLRDDGIIYEKILRRGGTETRIDLFPDDGHDAWVALPFPSKSKDPEIGRASMEGMAWLLGFDYVHK